MNCPSDNPEKCKCNTVEGARYIDWHDFAFCLGHYGPTKKFCFNCGETFCCSSFEPERRNGACPSCAAKRRATDTCEKDHSCKGGCGVRFCDNKRVEGIVYQDPPRHRPGWKNRKYKDWCESCYLLDVNKPLVENNQGIIDTQ